MSRFLRPTLEGLAPYVPGEQPRAGVYVKLNTNESPFPPSPAVLEAINRDETARLRLYSDPTALPLKQAIAETYGLTPGNVFCGNGSDEVLGLSFLAFAQGTVVAPAVSYGFYPVFARLFGLKMREVHLREDFSLPVENFENAGAMVVLANPNAPTGLALSLEDVERIVAGNPDHVVLVDEAYVDFGAQSALPLIRRYPHLLIVRTFSKSRSLAGARLGYALADAALIDDLERVRNSFHPYNINRLSLLAGVAAMRDTAYFDRCVQAVVAQRDRTAQALRGMGFHVTDSRANFLFAAHPAFTARAYYQALKARGVLIRCWDDPRLREHARISIGSDADMTRFLQETRAILAERSIP